MRTSARIATLALSLTAVVATTTVVLPQVAGSQAGSSAPAEGVSDPASASLTTSADAGLTGAPLDVTGTGCTQPGTTVTGDAVVVALGAPGSPPLVTATAPVAPDGSWSSTITAPAGTPAGPFSVTARCIAPEQELVVYEPVPFEVTGAGPEAAPAPASAGVAPSAAPTSTLAPEAGRALPTPTGGAIEPLPAYDPQTTCSPTAKPGTLAFQSMIMGEFPYTGVGSISRSCSSGGTSEHKEGRAWDWMINIGNSQQRAAGQTVINWLLATDRYGNRWANARRLGIMYIIWNRQMFRMYRPEDGWQPYNGANPHTDHIHFSLTRAGANRQTSFWTGGGTAAFAEFSSARTEAGGVFDPPVAGDFDGDGRGDVLWYGRGAAPDYAWWGNANRTFSGTSTNVGGSYEPVAGDFNGDGREDILWYAPGSGQDYIWYGNANRTFSTTAYQVNGRYRPLVGDWNGDGRDDVFWYGAGGAFDVIWYGSSSKTFRSAGARVSGTYQPLTGDFDGDGRSDIFWYGPGSGNDVTWYGALNGFRGKGLIISGVYPGSVVADLNGDRRDDIIWYAPGAGRDNLYLGQGNRTFRLQGVTVNGSYNPPLPADYDGNGYDDVLWYGPGAAADWVWWAS